MLRPILLILLFSVIAVTTYAQTPKDTLFFRNGTIVIGDVKRVQLGVITFDPDDANDITVQMRKLKAISAVTREFRIETVDHQVLYGEINPTVHDGFVTVSGLEDSTLVSLNNISSLYPVEAKLLKKIDGYIGTGFSYTKSSQLGRFNLDGKVMYQSKRVETGVNFSFISTIEENVLSRDNENASAPFNYYFHSYWFLGSLLSYQRNLELGIERRLQQGLGLGNKLITSRYVNLTINGGAVVNEEKSFESQETKILPEILFGYRLYIFKFEKPELSLSWSEVGYRSVTEERYRLDGDFSLTWEMIEDLDLNISVYSNYDSNAPGESTSNFDFGTVIGVRFDF
ncbi:MAG TPA: DUF481 domain-containing protein [Bacteroidia bacterium]|nr:DUF481 domain-containing protein [Bacteroidia bacterium]